VLQATNGVKPAAKAEVARKSLGREAVPVRVRPRAPRRLAPRSHSSRPGI